MSDYYIDNEKRQDDVRHQSLPCRCVDFGLLDRNRCASVGHTRIQPLICVQADSKQKINGSDALNAQKQSRSGAVRLSNEKDNELQSEDKHGEQCTNARAQQQDSTIDQACDTDLQHRELILETEMRSNVITENSVHVN